jgi:uroporphyrinogen decarboxylase
MTRKERVRVAITHREPDRVPHQINLTIPAREMLEAHLHTTDLDTVLDNHLAGIAPELAMVEFKPGYFRDEWGVVWNRTFDRDIGVIEGAALPEPSLAGLALPDPHDPRRTAPIPAFLQEHSDQFLLCDIGFSLFERAWTLRGLENFFMDLALNPGFVGELLDAITDYVLALVREAGRFGFDGFRFGDDWGQQSGVTMGPEAWRRFIKPRVARLYGAAHEAGKFVFIHSCGAVQALFPDLIEVGVDVFNPFQPEVMDVVEMKRRFGDRLAFYGGVSTQRTLPYGSPAEVRTEVRRLIREVGRGGGYILAPAHDVQRDVPLENLLALAEEARNQGDGHGDRP